MRYLIVTFADGAKYEYQCENEDAAQRLIAMLPNNADWSLYD